MALSTGQKSMIGDMLTWTALCAVAVATFVHYDSIKSFAGATLGIDVMATDPNAVHPAPPPETRTPAARTVELRAGANGHFHTRAEIDGRAVDVLVDTGATLVALTYDDARRAGVFVNSTDFTQSVSTANGIARVAPVTLARISIGGITVRNVPAAVAEPGRQGVSLLGMSFLGRLGRVEMRNGALLLRE